MNILINTTTFPDSAESPVPAFVLDQVKALHGIDAHVKINVVVPHHAYEAPLPHRRELETHTEIRYHYFWPRKFEKLTGRGILPAIKQNPLRIGLVPFHLFFQYRAMRKLCRETKPDIVYAHWFMSPAIISYFACKPFQIPLIFTTHASDVSILNKLPFAKSIISRVLNYAAAYTAVSNRTKKKMTDFFSPKEWAAKYESKMSVIPMGTHLNVDALEASLSSSLLQSIGISSPYKYILAMGRLAEKKGFNHLIEAYGNLSPQQQSEYQLVIAGDGQLKTVLQKQAQELPHDGDIIFPGYVNGDLKAALLSECSVFVMPSIIDSKGDSEGLPVTLMEALSKKRIVIATNVSGAEEVLSEDAGYLIEQKSAAQISTALNNAFSLTAAQTTKMQSKAGALSLQFDWREIAQRHLVLLRAAV